MDSQTTFEFFQEAQQLVYLCRKCVERKEWGSLLLGFLQRSVLVWAVTGVPSDREKRYRGVSAWPLWKAEAKIHNSLGKKKFPSNNKSQWKVGFSSTFKRTSRTQSLHQHLCWWLRDGNTANYSQNIMAYLLDSGVCRTKTARHCDGGTSACISSLGPPNQGAWWCEEKPAALFQPIYLQLEARLRLCIHVYTGMFAGGFHSNSLTKDSLLCKVEPQ